MLQSGQRDGVKQNEINIGTDLYLLCALEQLTSLSPSFFMYKILNLYCRCYPSLTVKTQRTARVKALYHLEEIVSWSNSIFDNSGQRSSPLIGWPKNLHPHWDTFET